MKYVIDAYSIWEFGKRKDAEGNPHQEDSLYPAHGSLSDADRTFILCDGMGGHDAGEMASATVCEAMSRSVLADGHDGEGIFTDSDRSRFRCPRPQGHRCRKEDGHDHDLPEAA